jgi:hypothetical protein
VSANGRWAMSNQLLGKAALPMTQVWRLRARNLRYARVTLTGCRLGYLGWLGHANIGDEAVFYGYQLAFAGRRISPLPTGPTLEKLVRLRRGHVPPAVLLGGGTIIGTTEFREAVTLLGAHGSTPFVLGAGVEDPAFPGAYAGALRAEQAHWPRVLERFDKVTVRGPLSQAILGSIGVEAEVVGDAALLLGQGTPTGPDPERRLGVNLGIASGLWGGDLDAVLDAVLDALRVLLDDGWRVTLFPVWPKDVPLLAELQRRLGGRADMFEGYLDVDALTRALSECRVFVGMKLHSVVLASAVFVPSLMLEYMPKCRDFQASLGREDRTLRTDSVSSSAIVEHVRELDLQRTRERDTLEAAVGDLRSRLTTEAARIGGRLEATLAR